MEDAAAAAPEAPASAEVGLEHPAGHEALERSVVRLDVLKVLLAPGAADHLKLLRGHPLVGELDAATLGAADELADVQVCALLFALDGNDVTTM